MNNQAVVFWEEAKKEIQLLLSKSDYDLWVSRLQFHDFDIENKIFVLAAPSLFIKNSCLSFVDTFELSLTKVFGENVHVKIDVVSGIVSEKETNKINQDIKQEDEIKLDNRQESVSETVVLETKQKKIVNPNILSFDSFIISHSNEYAATTARAIAENPGMAYNPYFIWGDSGLGKTHLLRAIERYDKQCFPSKKVLYITAEEFLNDFTKSISTRTCEQFRVKYRQLDVLLIDDIQFLSNKDETQMELFNTFNKLYSDNKQMVFSCDQPIEKVKNMEERLVSRFGYGLTVALKPPEFELRVAILQNWADAYNVNIKYEACEYIATNVTGNVRELKGMFNSVMSKASFEKKSEITKELTMKWLKDQIKVKLNNSPVSVDKIILTVANYYNLKSHEIIGECRKQSVAYARHIAMYLSRKLTTLSTTQIGSYFGNKEHATVMHAFERIQGLLEKPDEKTRYDIEYLTKQIQG